MALLKRSGAAVDVQHAHTFMQSPCGADTFVRQQRCRAFLPAFGIWVTSCGVFFQGSSCVAVTLCVLIRRL